MATDLKQSIETCHRLERELKRYKDSFGEISEDGKGAIGLALEVRRREEALQALKTKCEGLEMVCSRFSSPTRSL